MDLSSHKAVTLHFLETTSAHGLPHLMSSRSKPRKVFWALVFIGAAAYFLLQLHGLILTYLSYPVNVNTRMLTRAVVEFPSVTVCNMNKMLKSLTTNSTVYRDLAVIDNEYLNVTLILQQNLAADQAQQATISNPGDVKSPLSTSKQGKESTRRIDATVTTQLRISTQRTRRHDATTASPQTTQDDQNEASGEAEEELAEYFITERRKKRDSESSDSDYEDRSDYYGDMYNGSIYSSYADYSDSHYGDYSDYDHYGDYSDYDHSSDYSDSDNSESDSDNSESESDNSDRNSDNRDSHSDDDYYYGHYYEDDYYYYPEELDFETIYHDYAGDVWNPEFITSDHDFRGFLKHSKTTDLSDLVDVLRPSVEDLDTYGEKQEDFIMSCSFDKTHCSQSDFKTLYNDYYGKCFTFNHATDKQVLTTYKYGSRYGLRLTLNIHSADYVGIFTPEKGVRVAVHPANMTPFPEDDGVSAPPGQKTNIGVKLQKITRLVHPFASNCTLGEGFELNYKGIYTHLSCSLTCLQRNVEERCDCTDRPAASTKQPCSYIDQSQTSCRISVYSQFRSGELPCDCPLACSDLKYLTTVSHSQWPSESYFNMLYGTTMKDLLKDVHIYDLLNQTKSDFVHVHVYIEDQSIMSIEEFPAYEWARLLADMGGLLGLFVGISLCTGVEVLELIFDLLLVTLKKIMTAGKRNSRVTSSKPLSESSLETIITMPAVSSDDTSSHI